MNFINFTKANCKNCYKCLRTCPVKAIKIHNEQAEIVEERCISCGHCLVICPQNARSIKTDLSRVKSAAKEGKKLIASIAPSFPAAFDIDAPGQIAAALKYLGFEVIEETAAGAEVVSQHYKKYLESGSCNTIITTSCPAANFMLEKYFPSLVKYMIPVVSPMIAHGKMLKKKFGQESFVVFIGPCIAKKYESVNFQHEGIVDAVLGFEELNQWVEESGILFKELMPLQFNRGVSKESRSYPIVGGVVSSFMNGENPCQIEKISVDGAEECMEIFRAIEKGSISGVCIEANICKGGCLGGPSMTKRGLNHYEKVKIIKDYLNDRESKLNFPYEDSIYRLNYSKAFFTGNITSKNASEEDIVKVLKSMGKYTANDEMNCGVCGYNTCRDKALAVINGMAETNMCLDFMRNKAESLANIIFENTPNMIIVLDDKLNIKEINPSAEKAFHAAGLKDKPISLIMDEDNFLKVLDCREDIYRQKIVLKEYGLVLIQNILYLEKQNMLLAIMEDITSEENNREELYKVKESTINAAQEVINKQMRVAQEIASLLGETTAETKIILTKLKKIALGEAGDADELLH